MKNLLHLLYALFWVRWNRCIEHHADFIYSIEETKEEWSPLLRHLQFPEVPFPELEGKDNSKPHEELSWEHLARLNLDIFDEVRELAKGYGYTGRYTKVDGRWTEP